MPATRRSGEPKQLWHVEVHADPLSLHTWPILCGLTMLRDQGMIGLDIQDFRLPDEHSVWLQVLDVRSKATRTIVVDVDDSADLTAPERTARAQSLWKRSYVGGPGRPLGLLAPMRSGREPLIRYAARSSLATSRASGWRALRGVRRGIYWTLRRRRPPLVSAYESDPSGDAKLFLQVTAWPPRPGRNDEDRYRVTHQRADLIRGLKATFGDRFVGGFTPSDYVARNFPSLMSTLPTDQTTYLRLLKANRIAISTVGLHESNPFKLVEYLAASRAVVADRLRHRVAEPVSDVIESFDSIEECVNVCARLLDCPDEVIDLQNRSKEYWTQFVRPDRLVLRRLSEEFASCGT